MLRICNEAFVFGVPPRQFRESSVIPIYKAKGSSDKWQNYRGISLMSMGAKLFNGLILNRLAPKLDLHMRMEQNGLRRQRTTTHHLIFLRRLVEETKIRKEATLVLCFVDLAKAFDFVPRR